MSNVWSALGVFALLCASTAAGCFVRPRLPETHRARETTEAMQQMLGMLLTFAALVLSLLTASARSSYDAAAHDRQDYALQLVQLDRCLRDYGPAAEPARALLASYTAGVIASTWPREKPPDGVAYPNPADIPLTGASPVLERLMNGVNVELRRLTSADAFHAAVLAECRSVYTDVSRARLTAIEAVQASISRPFYRVLVFWLMVIFAGFGLTAPRNSLSLVGILLCAVSLSTVIFVISDLGRPYGGIFGIPSADMRTALTEMLAPGS